MSAGLEHLSSLLADRYRLERELGAGGMATVYLARDLRHERQVAIKVVKPEIVATIGADRFISEIRTTALLKHPHILPLFDSGAAGDTPFYVMPYIDGESLRARLRRDGALPIADAVRILRELADALTHAHGHGIVHRDIKPDNVLLSGRHLFLADFGIARALEGAASLDKTVTATSVIVGTPMYLSPEQAAGHREIDHRADIYTVGVVAYEMLAGAPPFTGDTGPMVMAAHLTAVPDPLPVRRPDVPPRLARLVMKCLEKRPEDRWQRAEDLLAELDALDVTIGTGAESAIGNPRRALALRVLAGLATMTLLIAGAWAMLWTKAGPPLAVGTMTHVTREAGLEIDPALSPDGRTLAYVAGAPGKRRVYVRRVDGGRPIALTETGLDGPQRRPDWSPDGSRIVFQAGQQGYGVRPAARTGTLYVVPALGGTATRLLPPESEGVALAPAWSPDGTRVAYTRNDGIYAVSTAPGAQPQPLMLTGDAAHSARWSPDSSHLVYVVGGGFFTLGEEQLGNTETSAIYTVTLATGVRQQITSGDWLDVSPVWMPDGRGLLFVSSRGGGRDVYRVRLSRSGVPEGEPERISSGLNAHTISLSGDGKMLAYSSLTFRANIWSAPILQDRIGTVADAEPITMGSERTEKLVLSRDGRWLLYDSDRNGNADVWKLRVDGSRGEPEQLTRELIPEFANDWSPDGTEILYHAIRGATRRDVMLVTPDGTRSESVAATSGEEQHGSWSPDGQSVVYTAAASSNERYDLHVTSRQKKAGPWVRPRRLTTEGGIDPKWSPDGRWIAYTRQGEVRLISPDGGNDHVVVTRRTLDDHSVAQYAIWSMDSQTLYVKATAEEARATIWLVPLTGGTSRLLMQFDDPLRPSLRREFATDGQKFYFTIAQDESDVWVMELK
jgi:eukaryotic-like serine/threonine-protein kinase